MVPLVAFDLGETLVSYQGIPLNWAENYRCAITAALDRFERLPTPSELESAISILNSYITRVYPRLFEVAEGEIVRKVAAVFGIDGAKFERGFFEHFQITAGPEPTALATLRELKNACVDTAVLSDVPYGMPRELILEDLAGLEPLIDVVLSSCDVGFRKPIRGGF